MNVTTQGEQTTQRGRQRERAEQDRSTDLEEFDALVVQLDGDVARVLLEHLLHVHGNLRGETQRGELDV